MEEALDSPESGENRARTPTLIRFDGIEIDLDGHRLRVNGVEAALEPKAFAVLALLLRHPGRALRREDILDAVWGHAHVTPSVLSRIINLLRQALGDDAQHPRWLHTVHGHGYRFDLPADAESGDSHAANGANRVATVAPTVEDESTHPPVATAGKRSVRYAVALLALLAILLAGWRLWTTTISPSTPETSKSDQGSVPVSLAVLPLVSSSGERGQEFFSDGLTESLISTLSHFDGMRIVGRGASFQLRSGKDDARTVSQKLGVDFLLGGSVRHDGDHVRISLELVRGADGSTIWTRHFDRAYRDLFALQDEVALAVAGALQIQLLHTMPSAVETGRPASGNLEAYDAYLHGVYHMRSDGDIRKAIEQFTRATELDPDYAQAWSWLGFQHTLYARSWLNGADARATYAKAREEIDTALRLQPDFGQAHAIRADLLSTANHDWNGALAEFKLALALVPDTDPTHGAYSRLLTTMGRTHEAIEERRRYIAGDPLMVLARVYLARLQASLGRLDEAQESLQVAAELEADQHDFVASERSRLAILRGDAVTALAQAESMSAGDDRDRAVALALQIGSDGAIADTALRHATEAVGPRKKGAYFMALLHALRGEADETFAWLQKDLDRGDDGILYVLSEPLLLRFRDDPRMAAYCARNGLPAPQASQARSLDQIRELVATRSP